MIAIVDYGGGNVGSLTNALNRLNVTSVVTCDIETIEAADAVILPGQGRAGTAMAHLDQNEEVIANLRQPVLGICLGMQILADHTAEDDKAGLGVFRGFCRSFAPSMVTPQIGWNTVSFDKQWPLFNGVQSGTYFYFANSYYVDAEASVVMATTPYGCRFASAIVKDNFYGVQFHPEKSGQAGEQLLRNFCEVSKLL
jgi:glutamine amidotransferase